MERRANHRRTALIGALVLLLGCGDSEPAGTAGQAPPGTSEAGVDAPPAEDSEQLRIGLASTAKRLCSSVFVAGRPREHVFAEELEETVAQGFEYRLTVNPDTVIASAAGQSATVLHRPALGCTLVDPLQVETLLAQFDPAAHPAPAPVDAARPWPHGSRVVLPDSVAGLDLAAVQAAVDEAFTEPDPDHATRTRAVLVVHAGRMVAERYAAPFDARTPQLGWSMTKTVTNALTGILVGDGVLEVAAPAPVPTWPADDARHAITLQHLLRMSSGLAFSEVYSAGSASDVIRMLYGGGAADMGAFAADMPLEHAPGTTWSYASGTTNLIAKLHRQAFDSLQDYFAFPRERLFNPLGMTSAIIEPDASGTFVGSSYMYATPRDWAKIGLLYLNDGIWNGRRILPPGWVDYSLTPAPAAPEGQYGAQIWLNRGTRDDAARRPHPELPTDLFYLSGFEGQNVVVVPSRDLVVVRMGLTRSGPRPIWTLTRRLLEAMD